MDNSSSYSLTDTKKQTVSRTQQVQKESDTALQRRDNFQLEKPEAEHCQ